MFFTKRSQARPPQYDQYFGDEWLPGQPVLQPAHQTRTSDVPWQAPGLVAVTLARQPYQAAVTGLSAPTPVLAAQTSDATPAPWTPARQFDIQQYYFLRAPTSQEAIVGPQYNPAQLLGLM